MKRLGHLDVYEVTLTTKAPLFVGEGKVYLGTDYLFDGDLRRVQILDQNQFFRMLIRYDLVDRYEHFILGGRKHLSAFLKENPVIPQEEIKAAVLYHVSAAYALTEKYSMKKIFAFTRDAANRVYIPGSTLKGAIRSALLFSMMEKGGGDFVAFRREGAAAHQCGACACGSGEPVADRFDPAENLPNNASECAALRTLCQPERGRAERKRR